jgi:hypothetical protein
VISSLLCSPASLTLAWRPFLDPIDAHSWWYLLLIPLALGISLAHRAVRLTDMSTYPRAVASLTAQIVVSIAALGIAAYLVIQVLVPALTPMPG